MKTQIEFNEFLEIEKNLEIKIGTITSVERIPKSNKMLKLSVDFGESEQRTVVTNIGGHPDLLEGKEQNLVNWQFPFITNLKPVSIMGVTSTAMIMLPEKDGDVQLSVFSSIHENTKIKPGSKLL